MSDDTRLRIIYASGWFGPRVIHFEASEERKARGYYDKKMLRLGIGSDELTLWDSRFRKTRDLTRNWGFRGNSKRLHADPLELLSMNLLGMFNSI